MPQSSRNRRSIKISDEECKTRTMIFAIPPNSQTSCFDRGKTESDGFAEGGRINMRDLVLVADSAV